MDETTPDGRGVLLETEHFDDLGGWVLDTQFARDMGSAYVLAHGLGMPVEDANTTVAIPEGGEWRIWVRAKDWVPGAEPSGPEHPGAFQIGIGDYLFPGALGVDGLDWHWANLGSIELKAGPTSVTLHDLTGFDGRCDAIYLTQGDDVPPEPDDDGALEWRKQLLGIADEPIDGGAFDVVVVGGGCPGASAALVSAEQGARTLLIQNRPMLGGNAAAEVGLEPRGAITPYTQRLLERMSDDSLAAQGILDEGPNLALVLDTEVYDVEMDGDRIVAVLARNLVSGIETRYAAKELIDATGNAMLALLAGAETMEGCEPKSTYGESLAPDSASDMHHGNTILFHTITHDHPVDFPDVPWALGVACDFDDLSGQMGAIGEENQPGPCGCCEPRP